MAKREREEPRWGTLVPHNPQQCEGPAPLHGRVVIVGREGDVRAPCNPHLSRQHIRLEREDGRVYATHLSAVNTTWLNGSRLEQNQRTLIEPCAGNAPHQLDGEADDAPLIFVSVVHARAARDCIEAELVDGWCGWSLRLEPANDCGSAAAASTIVAVAPEAVAPAPAPAPAVVVDQEPRTQLERVLEGGLLCSPEYICSHDASIAPILFISLDNSLVRRHVASASGAFTRNWLNTAVAANQECERRPPTTLALASVAHRVPPLPAQMPRSRSGTTKSWPRLRARATASSSLASACRPSASRPPPLHPRPLSVIPLAQMQANHNPNNAKVRCAVQMIEAVSVRVAQPLEYVLSISRDVSKTSNQSGFWRAIEAAVGRPVGGKDKYAAGVCRRWDPSLLGHAAPATDIDRRFVALRLGLTPLTKSQVMAL